MGCGMDDGLDRTRGELDNITASDIEKVMERYGVPRAVAIRLIEESGMEKLFPDQQSQRVGEKA